MAPFRNPAVTQPYGRASTHLLTLAPIAAHLLMWTQTQACENCSRSKCRCVAKPGGPGCERCHRLNRPCLPSDSTRSLNAQRNNPIARIAQLEGKLDGLVSLLRAGRVVTLPQSGHVLSPPPSNSSPPPSPGPTAAVPASSASPSLAFEPLSEEGDQCLSDFRSHMLKYFAIVDISADAQWLRQERPFLFLCIMAASSQSTQTKLALGERIKQTLAQRIILDNDPGAINIDLLLGLLTFLAWGHDHLLHGTAASLSRFTQLAMTLVFDLRLNKPLSDESNMLPVGSLAGGCAVPRGPARSMEERRAVLGCFVMSSIVSSYFAQIDAMQWTPYMEECLEVLSQNRECPYDEMFAHQVRLQRTAGELENARGTTTVPSAFYLAALQLKVDEIKANISPQLQQDGILLASVYYTELSIFGLVLSKQNTPGFQRLECLYSCLNTVKSALDNFFKIPLAEYPGIPFPFFTQLARYIVVLYKLSTLNDPTWDTGLVRSTVDVLQVMDQLISNIQHARAADGEKSAEGLLDKSTRIFVSVRSWCAAKLAENVGGGDSGNAGYQAAGEGGMLLEPLPLEDMWLKDNFTYGFLEENDFN